MQNLVVLDNDALYKNAPAIFAEKPFIGMSDNYKFIPTIEIVDVMRHNGFLPVHATQSHTRCAAKQGMQRHMVKFRQEEHVNTKAIVGHEVPEIVMVNSHDGSSLYELAMGIFRFVCGNGMVVQSSDFGSYTVKHSGMIDDLIETTFRIVADFPKAFAQIADWKDIIMPPADQMQYAERALLLKSPDNDNGVAPSLLLNARREDDESQNGNRDLWTTFNVVQENLIRGGLEGKSKAKGYKTKTRPVKAITEDLRLNKGLWQMTSDLAMAV